MSSRHAIEVFDPSVAKQYSQMEARAKMQRQSGHTAAYTGRAFIDPDIQARAAARVADAMAKLSEKFRMREDERRRRDPTYREDAIDLSEANMLSFDKWTDYYSRLQISEFASSLEIKKAHMRLALELHPDKQSGELSEEAREAVKRRFHEMVEAYNILSEPATRRAYDQARDNLQANDEAGLTNDIDPNMKLPPTCEDLEVTLEELYTGAKKVKSFTRNTFAVRWHVARTHHGMPYAHDAHARLHSSGRAPGGTSASRVGCDRSWCIAAPRKAQRTGFGRRATRVPLARLTLSMYSSRSPTTCLSALATT